MRKSSFLLLLACTFLLFQCQAPTEQQSGDPDLANTDTPTGSYGADADSQAEFEENTTATLSQGDDPGQSGPEGEGEQDHQGSDLITTKGSFIEIESGDYLHFMLEEEEGEKRSFWIAPSLDDDLLDAFLSNKYPAGTQVEVRWKTVIRFIPEAGEDMVLQEAQEIRVLD